MDQDGIPLREKLLRKLPTAWPLGVVGDYVAALQSGVSVNASERMENVNLEGIGVLKSNCVIGGKFYSSEHKLVVLKDVHKVSTPVLADRVIISRMNTPELVGESGYIKCAHPNLFLPDRLWQTVPSKLPHSQRWLSHYLQLSAVRNLIAYLATGTSGSMKNITKSALLLLPMPHVAYPEQEKIVAVIRSWDDCLESVEQKLVALRQVKIGAMQRLFSRGIGSVDAKGKWSPHTAFKTLKSHMGHKEIQYPASWKETTLEIICDNALQTGPFGSQLYAHEYLSDNVSADALVPEPDVPIVGVPVLMPKDLINYRANTKTAAKISPKRALSLQRHRLAIGDLIFSRRGDVTRFALIDEKSADSLCGTGCLKATPSDRHVPAFVSYAIQRHVTQHWLRENSNGMTMDNLNTRTLSRLPLLAASSKAEEQRIADILTCIDENINGNVQLRELLLVGKRAVIESLVGGEVRMKPHEGARTTSEQAEFVMRSIDELVCA